MDSSELAVNRLCTICVWEAYASPAGWRKLPAVFLGERDGIAAFLVHMRGDDQTRNLDDTLTEYNLAVDHWVVYADRVEHIVERADCIRFVNILGTRKTTHPAGSTEGQRFAEIARQAGLPVGTPRPA